MQCPVCSKDTVHFESALIMGKYDGHFRRCPYCRFIFAEKPLWLDEAYSSAISASDVGLVDRNIWFSQVTRTMVHLLCHVDGKFLDYGGGTGLLTKLMRDAGYEWYSYDRYCHNSCAEGFTLDIENGGTFELVTAVELFEHIADPVQIISILKKLSSNILFTTKLVPEPPPSLAAWWYYGLEHGQHISFYGIKSLQILAKHVGMHLASNGDNLHLLSRRKVPAFFLKIAANDLLGKLMYSTRKL